MAIKPTMTNGTPTSISTKVVIGLLSLLVILMGWVTARVDNSITAFWEGERDRDKEVAEIRADLRVMQSMMLRVQSSHESGWHEEAKRRVTILEQLHPELRNGRRIDR